MPVLCIVASPNLGEMRHALSKVNQLGRAHLFKADTEVPLWRDGPDAVCPVQFLRHRGFFVDVSRSQGLAQRVIKHHQGWPFKAFLMLRNIDFVVPVYQLPELVDISKDQHVRVHEHRDSPVVAEERWKVSAEGKVRQAPSRDRELWEDQRDNLDGLRSPADY